MTNVVGHFYYSLVYNRKEKKDYIMKKRKLFLSAIVLLSLTISACTFPVNKKSNPGESEPQQESSVEPISSIEEQNSSAEQIPGSETQPSSTPQLPSSTLTPSSVVPTSSKQPSSNPPVSSNPAPSSIPAPSSKPVSSAKPSSEPAPSSQPVSSTQPSSEPQPSSQPAPSSQPTPSSEPAPSSAPVQSSEPAPSSQPQPSSNPAPSSQPAPSSNPISSSVPASSSQPQSTSGFKNINDDQVFELHTAAQKAYLSYAGNYDEMPENQYPDGSIHQSDSNPINLTWDYTVPTGKTVSKYSVVFGQKADLSDGYQVDGTTSKSISFYNPYLGKNYYKLIATFTDSSKEETEIRTFNVDSTYPRNLTIGGMTNCRDMGGRVLEDGGTFKQGLIYRTSGYKYDYSTTITDAGTKEMLNHLKVKTEVNVADGTSYNLKLSGTTVKDFKMDYSGGSHHFSRNAESVKNFFNLLGDSSNYPVFFHCRIGTDRTGLCAILLSGLLGVSLNEIYQDYLFSNFGKIGEKRYIGAKAGADNIQNYIADIQAMSGETFKNKVYNMLLSIGVSKSTLDTIISNLTEGTPAQGNDANQVIGSGDKLVGNGVSVTNDSSDRDNPDKYFKLDSSSKSVSYTFNASSNYEGQVVVYMGNGDSSSSKYISDAISYKLDSTNVPIRSVSYADARMGKCSTRVNYYPVILGNTSISAGSHTITITGTSNSMNVAGIYIFDAATAGGGSSGEEGGEHTVHSYVAQTPVSNKAGKQVTTYLCDCGKKYIDIKFTDYSSIDGEIGSDGKIGGSNKVKTTFKWDIPAKAGNVKLMFNLKMSSSSSSHSSHAFDSSKYTVKINGTTQTLLLQNGKTYSELGLTTSGQYFEIAAYEILNDMNVEIEFVHNNSDYRLLFTENVRLMYE